jgi:hypothetical protein
MNTLVVVLLAFVVLGLLRERLGRATYALLAIIIAVYVIHGY